MRACGCHSRYPRRPGRHSRSPTSAYSSGTPRAVAQTTRLRGPVCPKTDSLAPRRSGLRHRGQAGHGEAAPEWIRGRRGRTPGPTGASG